MRFFKVFVFSFICFTSAYASQISVIEDSENHAFDIPLELVSITKRLYKTLNFSPLFLVSNLLDPQEIRRHLLTPRLCDGEMLTVTTDDNEPINCTYFNRNSNKLLVIGTGFGNEREKVAPLVHMFDSYDVVIFDYRGHGCNQPKLLDTTQWPIKPGQQLRKTIEQITPFINWDRIPNINLDKTTLGMSEEKDLLAVINYLSSQKKYSQTFGIGFCFSSFVFAKAAAHTPNLFDKLILDSSMYSPQNIVNRITESPQLLFDPQRGSWGALFKNNSYDTALLTKLASKFLQIAFSKLAITTKTTGEYLSQLTNTPILFFHGKDDKMTPYNEDFLKNFTQTKNTNKTAVVFENSRHLVNHIKYKELYKGISTFFFELPHESFISCLKKPDNFVKQVRENI